MPWWAILLTGYFSTSCAMIVWFTIIDRMDESFRKMDGKTDKSEFPGVGDYILIYAAVFFLWPFAIKDFIEQSHELAAEIQGEKTEK